MSIVNQNIEPMPTKKALVVDKISTTSSSSIGITGKESVKQLLEKLQKSGFLITGVKGIDDLFDKLKKRQKSPTIRVKMRTLEEKTIFQTLVFEKMEDFGPNGISQQSGILQLLAAIRQDMRSWKEAVEQAKLFKEKIETPTGKQHLLDKLNWLEQKIAERGVIFMQD